jgi:hypothetical protein
VLVVEPTNTWHAYDDFDGDSWYLTRHPRHRLTHPFAASRVNGKRVPAGLPEQFQRFDVGFLRWYWHSGTRRTSSPTTTSSASRAPGSSAAIGSSCSPATRNTSPRTPST